MDKTTRKYIRSKADESAVAHGCRFDEAAAAHVVEFFARFLRHSKGKWAGKPFELLDWQREDIIYPLFGWKRADGSRRFREAGVWVSKKNGKSTLAAGIGLYLLVGDGEAGAEVYSVAADREQASIVHGEAVRMVKASPELESALSLNRTTHNIHFEGTNSYYRALSSEANTKEGLNAHGLIIDELHAWKGRALWDTLRYAGAARSQPLRFVISTAGDEMQSIGRSQYEYAKGVLNGTTEDDRFFAYIREAEADDDWKSPDVWRKANPSFGETMTEEDFAADVRQAEKSPTEISSFKRYRLGIWNTSTNPWLKLDDWIRCEKRFTEDYLQGYPCVGGLDLSKTRDMTAFVLAFDVEDDVYILPYFWLPEDTVNSPDSPEEYRVWARNGHLQTTPGGVTDYKFVKSKIVELCERFGVKEFAYDPYNAEDLTQDIEENYGIKRFLFAQTIANFAEPTKDFERLVLSGRLKHNGHPVLTWQAGHVQVRSDNNQNIRPVKPPHGDHRKIDGIVAAIMAIARLAKAETNGPMISVW